MYEIFPTVFSLTVRDFFQQFVALQYEILFGFVCVCQVADIIVGHMSGKTGKSAKFFI